MIKNNIINIPKIIGHRGVKDLAPENTLNSIEKAINLDLSFVEIDVKISNDNIPFLLHDDDLDRTTTGKGLPSYYNYSEINKLDAGFHFYKKKTNIYPPTLKEVLFLCNNNNCGINIELKPNKGFEKKNVEAIINILKKFHSKIPIFFSSFDIQSCILIKELVPDYLCGYLVDNLDTNNFEDILNLIQKFNLFSCGLNTKIINYELVNILKKNNIFITAYSQKNIKYKEAFDLWSLGIDSIFSDDPRDLKF